MNLRNCQRCGSLFRGLSPFCQQCYETNLNICDYILKHEGVTFQELQERFSIRESDLNFLILQGGLGITSELVQTQCKQCDLIMTSIKQVGRLCHTCNDKFKKDAKLGAYAEAEKIECFPEKAYKKSKYGFKRGY